MQKKTVSNCNFGGWKEAVKAKKTTLIWRHHEGDDKC